MEKNPERYVLITGAAGGMGRIYAEKLAAAGYGLILVDINAQGLEETAAVARERFLRSARNDKGEAARNDKGEARNDSGTPAIITAAVDLTADDAAAKVRAAADAAGITVDILINNAGMLFLSDICETEPARLRRMVALHCTTPLLLCREFVPQMRERGWGRVLNISSMTSGMAWPCIGMYANTKRFVKAYSKSLRMECRGSGVKVTVASFGAVDTDLFGFNEKQRRFLRTFGAMISPEKAVTKALKAMSRGRRQITPGFLNRVITAVSPLAPDWLICSLYRRFGSALKSMQH